MLDWRLVVGALRARVERRVVRMMVVFILVVGGGGGFEYVRLNGEWYVNE